MRVWVVSLVGCTFTHGSLPSDAPSGSDASDAPAIDSAPTCIDRWLANTIRFGTPVQLAELSTSSFERDPFLVPDELTIYFSSGRSGDADVFVAKRATVGGTFGTPTEASPFNSTANDGKLSISADNKIAVVNSDRTGSLGYDVWQSIRTTSTDAWPALDRTDLSLVNSTGNEYDPMLSADGTQLYLAPDSPGPQHIVVATRDSLGMFGPPTTLTQLDSATGDADPVPSFDQRVLVFASNRALAGAGNGDLWYATRAAATGAFGAPMPVPDVNTSLQEGDPHLSSDGCRLYFARRIGGMDYDIFLSVAQ